MRIVYIVLLLLCAVSFVNAQSFTYFTFDPPGFTATTPTGINNNGQIVGRYQDASGFHYFLRTGAVYTNNEAPGTSQTILNAINNLGRPL